MAESESNSGMKGGGMRGKCRRRGTLRDSPVLNAEGRASSKWRSRSTKCCRKKYRDVALKWQALINAGISYRASSKKGVKLAKAALLISKYKNVKHARGEAKNGENLASISYRRAQSYDEIGRG